MTSNKTVYQFLSYFLLSILLLGCGGGGNGGTSPNLISCTAPNAIAGQTVTVSCSAVGSATPTLQWEVKDANGNTVNVNTSGMTATFTPTNIQTYTVTVTATAGTDTEIEKLTVAPGSPPLTVSCTVPTDAKAGREVTVDCTASDYSGGSLTYAWTITPPAGTTVSLQDSTVEDAVFTPPSQGNYLLELTVTAADGQTATALVSVNVGRAEPWKIMLIGDSITQSNLQHQSYRYVLWKKLVEGNYDIDLIGSQHVNASQDKNGPLPTGTTQVAQPDVNGKPFDPDHEAYWGERADQVLTRLQTSLPGLSAPDIAVIHLGTNDIFQSQTNESTITDLKNIISELRQKNPNVTVIVARIIPFAGTEGDTGMVVALNNLIDGLDDTSSQPGSPVIIVDQYAGYDADNDNFDGIHPKASGEEKLATKFYAELQKLLK